MGPREIVDSLRSLATMPGLVLLVALGLAIVIVACPRPGARTTGAVLRR